MSINPLLLPVKKDVDTIRETVLTNIVKMLYNRKWITEDNLQKQITNIISSHNDDHIYKVFLDVSLSTYPTYDPTDDESQKKVDIDFEDKIVMIKLLPQKVTSILKSPIITEFISTYKKVHKILIVDGMPFKTKYQITSKKYIEVFDEVFFMINLLENTCSPKYEVLTSSECTELLTTYHLSRRQMKLMLDNDPVSLYLFLKKKQIVRIIRDSELTGKAVDYRIVVHKG